jgi:hypothetical protein
MFGERMDKPYSSHLRSGKDIQTSYEAVRAGFVALALEKNRQASPYVEEARVLKVLAEKAKKPADLVKIKGIESGLLTAAGISEKANVHLLSEDKQDAIRHLIDKFLEPAGEKFVEELVFRFLLIRGDALGGSMRNIGGVLAERKFVRILISTLKVAGISYEWLHNETCQWCSVGENDADIELFVKGISWQRGDNARTLLMNISTPIVGNNIDLCLFDVAPKAFAVNKTGKKLISEAVHYLALGELKGGIDPAGADEHWKTARTALTRIRESFKKVGCYPATFFIGAAIEKKMAAEIWNSLKKGTLNNAANLNSESQMVSISKWLLSL